MSGFMQKIFGTDPTPAPAPVATTAAPATPPQGGIPPNAGVTDPLVPAAPVTTVAEPVDNSPLAPYQKLWETKPDTGADGVPKPPEALKVEDIQAIVNKQDFVSMLSPEQLAAVTAGDEGSQAALSEMLNTVVKNVMVQNVMVNNQMTQQAVTKAIEAQSATIPGMLRANQARDHLNTENPIFSNPAVKPIMEAAHQQLIQQHPNATAAELTKMTQDYVLAMGEAFAPPPATTTLPDGETDWSNFENQ